jgi:hypothetical protein
MRQLLAEMFALRDYKDFNTIGCITFNVLGSLKFLLRDIMHMHLPS